MKIARLFALLATVALIGAWSAPAAPVESVESPLTAAAFQKVDAFLSERAVVDELTKLGVTRDQIQSRLAKLNDIQIEELAAQIDTLHAGGKIQCGCPHPLGPLGCVLRSIHESICHLVRFLFCWDDIR
jgi:hypothetical protein